MQNSGTRGGAGLGERGASARAGHLSRARCSRRGGHLNQRGSVWACSKEGLDAISARASPRTPGKQRATRAGSSRFPWLRVRGPRGTCECAPGDAPPRSGSQKGPSGASADLGGGRGRGPQVYARRADPPRASLGGPGASRTGHSAGRSGREAQAAAQRAPGGRAGGRATPARGQAGRDGPPPPAALAVRRRRAALRGAGQGHPAPRAARAARCRPLQPLHAGMAPAPAAAQVRGRAGAARAEPGVRDSVRGRRSPTCLVPPARWGAGPRWGEAQGVAWLRLWGPKLWDCSRAEN